MKFRKSKLKDIAKILEMIADDKIGKTRENFKIPLPQVYLNAF